MGAWIREVVAAAAVLALAHSAGASSGIAKIAPLSVNPPNLEEVECAFMTLAYEVATTKVTSNHGAIRDALFSGTNCTWPKPSAAGLSRAAAAGPGSQSALALAGSVVSRPSRGLAAGGLRSVAPAPAHSFYVSTTGNDAWPGTLAQPFATLTRARTAVRALGPPAQRGPAAVLVRGGHYYLGGAGGGGTLELSSQDSGVAWQAYSGEAVTLSGGRLLSGLHWTRHGSGPAYVAPVDLPRTPARVPRPHADASVGPCADGTYCDAAHYANGTDYDGHDVKKTHAANATECCAMCASLQGCSYFTWVDGLNDCFLKSSDAGARPYAGHTSGSPSRPPPPPPPPHRFGPAPAEVNSLFVDGVRQVRARFPNGNPQAGSGLCFSKTQRPGEGCAGYLQATGQAGGSLPAPAASANVAFGLDRGQSPRFGCKQCSTYGTFHYSIYAPPAGHPVYTAPLPGVGWSNTSLFSFWGSPFARPAGFTFDRATWSNRSWANASGAVVHMFHEGLWGGWQYRVTDVNASAGRVSFGYGGYQEARGSGIKGNHFYIENVLEELDAPGEWFFDEAAQLLYLYPNGTDAASATSPSPSPSPSPPPPPPPPPQARVVVPLLDSIIVVKGSGAADPVTDLSFEGFTFTETRSTFLRAYEVPSGGDWSVHRGGTVLVQDAARLTLTRCAFNQTGGNAVVLSNHVVDSEVSHSEFVHTGDSAVVLLGSTDTIFGTAPTYPNRVRVANNHMHEVGVYGKQTSCLFTALAANTTVVDNVCYNGPRAGFNINDGFGGNMSVAGNVIFNQVRETGDHGPLNSWNRQPYLTYNGVDDGFNATACPYCPPGSSIIRANDTVTRNLVINGYRGVWTLDRDDGSQFVRDTGNLLVFGGCKNYLGHSKSCSNNLIVYPGIPARSDGNRKCQTDDGAGGFANQYYFGNQCVTEDGDAYTWGDCTPGDIPDTVYHTWNNSFFAPAAAFSVPCTHGAGGTTFKSLSAWQAAGGQDAHSSVAPTPSVAELVAMGKHVLATGTTSPTPPRQDGLRAGLYSTASASNLNGRE